MSRDEQIEAIAIAAAGMENWPTIDRTFRDWHREQARIALDSPDLSPEDADAKRGYGPSLDANETRRDQRP